MNQYFETVCDTGSLTTGSSKRNRKDDENGHHRKVKITILNTINTGIQEKRRCTIMYRRPKA